MSWVALLPALHAVRADSVVEWSLLARAEFFVANIDISALCSVGNLIQYALSLSQSYAGPLAFLFTIE